MKSPSRETKPGPKKPPAARRSAQPRALPDVKKSELTRRRILDAAAQVFAEQGYGHTRLSDVARKAGTHAGGIYYYFASREALVEEVLRTCTLFSLDNIHNALSKLPPDASAPVKMRAAAEAQIDSLMRGDAYNRAFSKIFSQVPQEIREKHRPLLGGYFSIWRRLIRSGQDAGEIRADIDPAVLRLTISGALQWTEEWASSSHGSASNLATNMMDIFFRGMLANPSAGPPAQAGRRRARAATE